MNNKNKIIIVIVKIKSKKSLDLEFRVGNFVTVFGPVDLDLANCTVAPYDPLIGRMVSVSVIFVTFVEFLESLECGLQ